MKTKILFLILFVSTIGVAQNIEKQFNVKFNYPNHAIDSRLEGTTIVEFYTDDNYSVKSPKLLSGEKNMFSNEVLRVINDESFNLKEYHLKPGKKYNLIVSFNLYESNFSEDYYYRKCTRLLEKYNYSKALKLADKGLETYNYSKKLYLLRSQIYDCLGFSDLAKQDIIEYQKLDSNTLDVIYVYYKTVDHQSIHSRERMNPIRNKRLAIQ